MEVEEKEEQVIAKLANGATVTAVNLVTINTDLDGAFTATWNGSDQLTINSPPDVLVFRKQ